MRSLYFLTSFLYLGLLVAQNDSLVRFSDLQFRNDAERNTFRNFQAKGENSDVIDLFMTHYAEAQSYSPAEAHRKITATVRELKEETEGWNDQKKVKYIYSYIHKHYFEVYQRNNSFCDIFEKGEYNCVSGSAMYAIIFKMMDIPYQIVEAPQHVFLFAYPQTHKLMVESTSPKHGYLSFSEAYVQRYVDHLGETKMVSADEIRSASATEIFNTHYFSKKGLSIQELAGIQYANFTYYYTEAQEHEKALEEAKKAYFICPNERNAYVLQSMLFHVVTNRSYKEEKDVANLVLLCRFNGRSKNDVSDEGLKQEFGRLTQEQLISRSDHEQYGRAFACVMPEVKDSAVRNELAFIYNYELARLGISGFRNKEFVMQHLKAAYDVKPKHADLRAMIKYYFARLAENKRESSAMLTEMNAFTASFGFLSEDEGFNTVKADCYLERAYEAFTYQDIKLGEEELRKFEQLCKEQAGIKPGEHFVEKAYSSAAAYYYKKGNKPKTRELLKKGLSYAPENFGLQVRLSQAR